MLIVDEALKMMRLGVAEDGAVIVRRGGVRRTLESGVSDAPDGRGRESRSCQEVRSMIGVHDEGTAGREDAACRLVWQRATICVSEQQGEGPACLGWSFQRALRLGG